MTSPWRCSPGLKALTDSHPRTAPIRNMMPMFTGMNHLNPSSSGTINHNNTKPLMELVRGGNGSGFWPGDDVLESDSARQAREDERWNEDDVNNLQTKAARGTLLSVSGYGHTHTVCWSCGVTLLMFLRASDVRRLKRPDARRAPSNPTRRTCRTGSHATTSRDQNLIFCLSSETCMQQNIQNNPPPFSVIPWRKCKELAAIREDILYLPASVVCVVTKIFAGRDENETRPRLDACNCESRIGREKWKKDKICSCFAAA